jgi:TPP-dependent indolepyruvate ferredoxin oxidoreductase alpha subunit
VRDVARLLVANNAVAEQRDQLAALNRTLKNEGEKLIEITNTMTAELLKMREEYASILKLLDEKTSPQPEKPAPMVGICTGCPHDASFHANPSKLCTHVGCPCMKWKAPITA